MCCDQQCLHTVSERKYGRNSRLPQYRLKCERLATSETPLDIVRRLFLQFLVLRNVNFIPEAVKDPLKMSEQRQERFCLSRA